VWLPGNVNIIIPKSPFWAAIFEERPTRSKKHSKQFEKPENDSLKSTLDNVISDRSSPDPYLLLIPDDIPKTLMPDERFAKASERAGVVIRFVCWSDLVQDFHRKYGKNLKTNDSFVKEYRNAKGLIDEPDLNSRRQSDLYQALMSDQRKKYDYTLYIAAFNKETGAIVGTLDLSMRGRPTSGNAGIIEFHVESLAVQEAHRGRKISKLLLAYVFELVSKFKDKADLNGIESVEITVTDTSNPTLPFALDKWLAVRKMHGEDAAKQFIKNSPEYSEASNIYFNAGFEKSDVSPSSRICTDPQKALDTHFKDVSFSAKMPIEAHKNDVIPHRKRRNSTPW